MVSSWSASRIQGFPYIFVSRGSGLGVAPHQEPPTLRKDHSATTDAAAICGGIRGDMDVALFSMAVQVAPQFGSKCVSHAACKI